MAIDSITHKAFIIDDEMDICFLLGNVLKQKKMEPEYATTLKEATKVLKGVNPEIIFLDNHLPDGLGVNFIKHIKSTHPSTKIVMITAHDNQSDRNKAIDEGADYFMSKPFSKDTVKKIVDTFIN